MPLKMMRAQGQTHYLVTIRRTGTAWEARVFNKRRELVLVCCGPPEFVATAAERAELLGLEPLGSRNADRVPKGKLYHFSR